MRILKMQAAFGKLDGNTLQPGPGLTVIQAPNEHGKSTWCAFLRTMLYGLDTSRRDRADALSDKTKYSPWDGTAMAGLMLVEWGGRQILLRRSSTAKGVMKTFSAQYEDTGTPVPEMDGASAGRMLTGAEQAVFERTAFIGQNAARLEPSRELEKRMASIVTAGSETLSARDGDERLGQWQRRILYRDGGLLGNARRERADLTERLEKLRGLEKRAQQLQNTTRGLEQELSLLGREKQALERAELMQRKQRADHHLSVYRAVESRRERLEQALTVNGTSVDRKRYEDARTAYEEYMTREQLCQQMEQDAPDRKKGRALLPAIAAAALAVVCLVLAFVKTPLPAYFWGAAAAVFACACVGFAVWTAAEGRRRAARRLEARRKADEARIVARQRADACGLGEDLGAELAVLARTLDDLDKAGQDAKQSSELYEAWRLPDGTVIPPEDDVTPRYDRQTTEQTMQSVADRVRQIRGETEHCLGQISAMGSSLTLESRLRALEQRIGELTSRYDALTLAREALASADETMQSRFSPEIGAKAGSYLRRLTNGRYDGLRFDRDMSITVTSPGDMTPYREIALSQGTAEQIYLALRLALCDMLLGGEEPCPVVLDDALAMFDDERAALALDVLAQEAETRQILLFTCHSREARILAGRKNVRIISL